MSCPPHSSALPLACTLPSRPEALFCPLCSQPLQGLDSTLPHCWVPKKLKRNDKLRCLWTYQSGCWLSLSIASAFCYWVLAPLCTFYPCPYPKPLLLMSCSPSPNFFLVKTCHFNHTLSWLLVLIFLVLISLLVLSLCSPSLFLSCSPYLPPRPIVTQSVLLVMFSLYSSRCFWLFSPS